NLYLGEALAAMEFTETANVASSGMGAITSTLLHFCGAGDHIVSSRTIYGGTYAFLKNFAPRFNVNTHFVNITKLEEVEAAINEHTKVIYCEAVSNPLLEVADIKGLAALAKKHNLKLLVDNTFSPMIISPQKLGADVVLHSLTKFINGTNDTMGGVVCGSQELINEMLSVIDGSAMLLGPTLDSIRASSILKNMRTLHIRIKQHSKNAGYLAEGFEKLGLKTVYPGLVSHPSHELFKSMMNEEYGFGGQQIMGTMEVL
ncbi:aminotransferase class V-fold PLP-dependent enzyme, partial [Flavobacteriaceae bacterium]|nr:aminotransferase class V-fold PLP-dependent enzyme [Flavobacteriaceae bacterium]